MKYVHFDNNGVRFFYDGHEVTLTDATLVHPMMVAPMEKLCQFAVENYGTGTKIDFAGILGDASHQLRRSKHNVRKAIDLLGIWSQNGSRGIKTAWSGRSSPTALDERKMFAAILLRCGFKTILHVAQRSHNHIHAEV